MLFLLNDQVLKIERAEMVPPIDAERFRRLSFDFVCELGRELFADEPLLQETSPARAVRLAALIGAKAPQINAALFVAPSFGCNPDLVTCQFAEISFDMMAWLYQHQRAGELTNLVADKQVWRRLAA
jgi:hypothetical protein